MNLEELGEGLADHENRISQIEASLYYPNGLTPQARLDKLERIINEISISSLWSTKQWDTVQQMQAMILHLQKGLGELQDAKKKRKDKI